ncbi:hypothetical protein LMIY3S_04503 [Labrys miyagiensis]
MSTKLIAATMVALLAGGLGACSTQRGYPYSATDCRYAGPLPRHWVPNAYEGCEHYRPWVQRDGYKHYRHYRHVKHGYRHHPHQS